jgi:gliding motility-associated-like protein
VNLFAAVQPSSYPFYAYSWSPAGGLDNPNVRNPNFTGLTSTTLTVTVTTPAGCLGSDNVFFEVIAPDIIQALALDTLLCPRDTAQLSVTGTAVSVIWSPDIYLSDADSTTVSVWPSASTVYTVIGTDINNCKDTASIEVTVYPDAVLSLPDSARIYPGESYQIDPSGNTLYYQWFPPQGLSSISIANPIAQPTVDTRYFVQAATENGCLTQDSIDIYVSTETPINIPNAFTPGSEPNSSLKVNYRGIATLKSFSIYNRWGTKVFETTNIDEGWDGRFNGEPQPMGVYIYMVEAVSSSGRKFVKQGNITLIR